MAYAATYRTDSGRKAVIVGEAGRKYLPVCIIDYPVRVTKLPLSEQRYIEPIEGYPLRKAVAKFRQAGKTLGISKSAKDFLRRVMA